MSRMDHLIHRELSQAIIGAAMTVLNTLKPGLDEKLYEIELQEQPSGMETRGSNQDDLTAYFADRADKRKQGSGFSSRCRIGLGPAANRSKRQGSRGRGIRSRFDHPESLPLSA